MRPLSMAVIGAGVALVANICIPFAGAAKSKGGATCLKVTEIFKMAAKY